MPLRGSSCSGGAASLYTRLLIAHEHSGKEHPLQAQYSHPKLRCFNRAFLIPKCVVPAGVPEPRSPSTPLCAVQAFSLIPQNKQDFFYIFFFFTPLLLFIFFPPFFHTPRAAVAGGREPRLCRNSEMLRIQALAALSVSQSFGRGEREGIK